MRTSSLWFASFALLACSESPPAALTSEPDAGDGGSEDAAPSLDAGAADADAPVEEPLGPPIGAAPAPTKLADDAVTMMGITSDGWVVYRSSQGVVAIPADGKSSTPTLVSESLGMVHIRGPVVFVYADVDWAKNVGELTIWTAAHGARSMGLAGYGEDIAFATADGSWVGFVGNVTTAAESSEAQGDVVLTTSDFASQHVVLSQIGVGSGTTCRPRVGFVGQRLFAGWCKAGSAAATLQAFAAPAWTPITIASEVNPTWSVDGSGQTLFYTDLKGGGWLYKPTKQPSSSVMQVDKGVGWGTLLYDGSGVIYNVADQLRKKPTSSLPPIPLITNGFVGGAGFSPDQSYFLYSTKITYEPVTRRDLFITPTTSLNLAPVRLIEAPMAEISRSVFTSNGKWVIYLEADPSGKKKLHLRSVSTTAWRQVEDVDTVVAATGSRVVYSKNRSEPPTYPITADLEVADPAAAGEPVSLRTGTTDGRNFHLSSDQSQVFYVVPPDGTTPSALYAQRIP